MKYNPEKHHRRSIRLKGYDYSQAGFYFITICCQDKKCLFGQIRNGEMVLNKYGQIAHNEWLKTPQIRDNVELGAFIIMPNHIHGIIHLTRTGESHSPGNGSHSPIDECNLPDNIRDEFNSSLRGPSNNIGAIVRGYKSSVTKQLNALNIGCTVWQRNYYEHIIRNEKAYRRIAEYIIDNPIKWDADKFFTAFPYTS